MKIEITYGKEKAIIDRCHQVEFESAEYKDGPTAWNSRPSQAIVKLATKAMEAFEEELEGDD